jgi:phosphotransferase system  glucose/maltose/N-acetylglucosamine-specific IIC component
LAIILILLALSTMLGTATGLTFKVQGLIPVSILIAILAAVALHSAGFGPVGGVLVIVACLVVAQLAYLSATFFLYKRELSLEDEIDGDPGKPGK